MGAVICPSNRRSSAAWTSQTSSGKYWSLLSQSHLEEKTDEAGPGETHAMSWTASSGNLLPDVLAFSEGLGLATLYCPNAALDPSLIILREEWCSTCDKSGVNKV
jgi:hypothetical protein